MLLPLGAARKVPSFQCMRGAFAGCAYRVGACQFCTCPLLHNKHTSATSAGRSTIGPYRCHIVAGANRNEIQAVGDDSRDARVGGLVAMDAEFLKLDDGLVVARSVAFHHVPQLDAPCGDIQGQLHQLPPPVCFTMSVEAVMALARVLPCGYALQAAAMGTSTQKQDPPTTNRSANETGGTRCTFEDGDAEGMADNGSNRRDGNMTARTFLSRLRAIYDDWDSILGGADIDGLVLGPRFRRRVEEGGVSPCTLVLPGVGTPQGTRRQSGFGFQKTPGGVPQMEIDYYSIPNCMADAWLDNLQASTGISKGKKQPLQGSSSNSDDDVVAGGESEGVQFRDMLFDGLKAQDLLVGAGGVAVRYVLLWYAHANRKYRRQLVGAIDNVHRLFCRDDAINRSHAALTRPQKNVTESTLNISFEVTLAMRLYLSQLSVLSTDKSTLNNFVAVTQGRNLNHEAHGAAVDNSESSGDLSNTTAQRRTIHELRVDRMESRSRLQSVLRRLDDLLLQWLENCAEVSKQSLRRIETNGIRRIGLCRKACGSNEPNELRTNQATQQSRTDSLNATRGCEELASCGGGSGGTCVFQDYRMFATALWSYLCSPSIVQRGIVCYGNQDAVVIRNTLKPLLVNKQDSSSGQSSNPATSKILATTIHELKERVLCGQLVVDVTNPRTMVLRKNTGTAPPVTSGRNSAAGTQAHANSLRSYEAQHSSASFAAERFQRWLRLRRCDDGAVRGATVPGFNKLRGNGPPKLTAAVEEAIADLERKMLATTRGKSGQLIAGGNDRATSISDDRLHSMVMSNELRAREEENGMQKQHHDPTWDSAALAFIVAYTHER